VRQAHVFLSIGVIALVGTPCLARDATGPRISGFVADGHRHELRVTAREATIRPWLLGQLLLYTVSRDGKFVHPERPDGGRLLGCVRAVGGTEAYLLEPFPDAPAPRGWMLGVGAACGNTSSSLVTLVMPGMDVGEPTYFETSFESKFKPVARRLGDDVEVWSARQWWGRGGTSSSVFVPECRIVAPDGRVRLKVLDADWSRWPVGFRDPGFGALFVAGLEQENPTLMRRALDVFCVEEDAMRDWTTAVGLPAERTLLLQLTDAVGEVARAKARLAESLAPSR
jgi:hypothetical protein